MSKTTIKTVIILFTLTGMIISPKSKKGGLLNESFDESQLFDEILEERDEDLENKIYSMKIEEQITDRIQSIPNAQELIDQQLLVSYSEKYDAKPLKMPKDEESVEFKYRTLYLMIIYDYILEIEGFCLEREEFDIEFCNEAIFVIVAKIRAMSNLRLRERYDYVMLSIRYLLTSLPKFKPLYDLMEQNKERFDLLINENSTLIGEIKAEVEIEQ